MRSSARVGKGSRTRPPRMSDRPSREPALPVERDTEYRGHREKSEPIVMCVVRGYSTHGLSMVVTRLNPTGWARSKAQGKFDWGREGAAPMALAHSILADVGGESVALTHYRAFVQDHVKRWDDEWTIRSSEIEVWIRSRMDRGPM